MRTRLLLGLLVGICACSSDDPTPCGDSLTCAIGEACVVTIIEPACTDNGDGTQPCPEGTEESNCGGAGLPCCCEPRPDPDRACVDAPDCGSEIACECVDACGAGDECTDSGAGEVTCAPPPAP